MSVSKLEKGSNGAFICPECGGQLAYLDGGQVRVIAGKVDYDNVKPKHACRKCNKYYRELLDTGYYDVFTLTDEEIAELDKVEPVAEKKSEKKGKSKFDDPVVALKPNGRGGFDCPVCRRQLTFSDGGAVRVVDGKVDYENVKPRYICNDCEIYYRELLHSGLYEVFDLPEIDKKPEEKTKRNENSKKREVRATGDLAPMQLRRDADGKCACPRCGADMVFLEPEAVKIVNGRADMSDTVARFRCDECSSIYRRISSTDYYQWCEK